MIYRILLAQARSGYCRACGRGYRCPGVLATQGLFPSCEVIRYGREGQGMNYVQPAAGRRRSCRRAGFGATAPRVRYPCARRVSANGLRTRTDPYNLLAWKSSEIISASP